MPTPHAARRIAAAALSLFTLFALSPAFAEDKTPMRSITVSATGEVSAEPDMASVSSGVITEAANAREALSKNSAAMKRLIAGLKSAGVEPKDIQTTGFNVNPVYSNPQEGRSPSITGYQVHNQVTILARDLDKLGDVLDNLVTLGANQMNGLSFEVSKAETLKDEARNKAVANARRRAELFAAAAGAQIGEVLTISEQNIDYQPHPMAYARAAKADAVPVERGTATLTAGVTVTWALK